MSKTRDEAKVTCGSVAAVKSEHQSHQPRTKARQNHVGDGNQLTVLNLRFADDFAEYVARAEGGGSTYGVLRRHAYAQSSLRHRRPTAADDGGDAGNARPAATRQRRSRSLVPPRRRSRDLIGSPDNALPNHKTLLQALCAQTQQQQQKQQQQETKHADTLQVHR